MRVVKSKTVIALVIGVSLSMTLLLWGCTPRSTQPRRSAGSGGTGPGGVSQPAPAQIIGTVQALQGPDVTVGGRAATLNMPVRVGEMVRTGPGSTVTVGFSRGGVMQLGENTDPIFTLIKEGVCLLIQMFTGHAQLDSGGQCVEVDTPESGAFIGTKLEIRVEGGRTTFKVLDGRINVASKVNLQRKTVVATGQQTVVTRAKVDPPRVLPQVELRNLNDNFLKIRVPPTKLDTTVPRIR